MLRRKKCFESLKYLFFSSSVFTLFRVTVPVLLLYLRNPGDQCCGTFPFWFLTLIQLVKQVRLKRYKPVPYLLCSSITSLKGTYWFIPWLFKVLFYFFSSYRYIPVPVPVLYCTVPITVGHNQCCGAGSFLTCSRFFLAGSGSYKITVSTIEKKNFTTSHLPF